MTGFDRDEFIQLARRTHAATREAVFNSDLRKQPGKEQEWRRLGHYMASNYLISSLAYLEGQFGARSWQQADFDSFVSKIDTKGDFARLGTSRAQLDALWAVRNAIVHNGADLLMGGGSRARLNKVTKANLASVQLSGSVIELEMQDQNHEFTAQVRQAVVAVVMYHGHG